VLIYRPNFIILMYGILMPVLGTETRPNFWIYSWLSLSWDRSIASSTNSSPCNAIHFFLSKSSTFSSSFNYFHSLAAYIFMFVCSFFLYSFSLSFSNMFYKTVPTRHRINLVCLSSFYCTRIFLSSLTVYNISSFT